MGLILLLPKVSQMSSFIILTKLVFAKAFNILQREVGKVGMLENLVGIFKNYLEVLKEKCSQTQFFYKYNLEVA